MQSKIPSTDAKYASTKARNFFACPEQDAALMRMLHFVVKFSEISSTRTEGKTEFVGEDNASICFFSEIDLKMILCKIVPTGWYQCIRYTTTHLRSMLLIMFAQNEKSTFLMTVYLIRLSVFHITIL